MIDDFNPGQVLARAALSSMRDALLVVRITDGDIQYCNPAAVALFKIEADDTGVKFPDILSLLGKPNSPWILKHDLIEKGLRDPKYQVVRTFFLDAGDNQKQHIELHIVPSGEENLAIVMIIDRTSEYNLEMVHSDFVYLASHQLRTPLTAIKWYMKMYIDKYGADLKDEQSHIINNVSLATQEMINLVEGLLNISRIEAERDHLNLEEVEMNELLNAVVKDMQPIIESKKLRAVTSIHRSLPNAVVDKTMLKYVLINLLSNAINYSKPNGEIRVIISHPSKKILVQISDDGIGIPKELQKNVFKRFFRAENAKKTTPLGSGLGLSLTRRIVESMGGEIWFDSTEGSGTTFWFTVPEEKPNPFIDNPRRVI